MNDLGVCMDRVEVSKDTSDMVLKALKVGIVYRRQAESAIEAGKVLVGMAEKLQADNAQLRFILGQALAATDDAAREAVCYYAKREFRL